MVEHNTVNIVVRCSIHLKGCLYFCLLNMCVSLIGRAMCYGHMDTGSSLVHAAYLSYYYSSYINVHIL